MATTAKPATRSSLSSSANGEPLLVFADDWGRHPSSCQHLMRRLLPRHAVTWVNTIMRPPRLDWATLHRGWEKARQWVATARVPTNGLAEPSPKVVNPRMWPWFSSTASRKLNRWMLMRQLGPIVQKSAVPTIAVTTLPIVADLVGALPVRRWVYYCVDDFTVWPGLDGRTLQQMENDLVPRVDEIVVVSETLRSKMARMGRSAHLLTHGIDLPFWTSTDQCEPPPAIQDLERPLIVFWGVVDRRMSIETVRKLAHGLKRGTVALAGPVNDPDPELLTLPRVVPLGPLPFEQLPELARQAAVLIMPYADLPVTRAIQPLKLKEYLATGRPVVVADLPATRDWGDCLDLASEPDAFAALVQDRIESGVPESQRIARHRLSEESWDAKAREFETWICTDSTIEAL